MDIGISEGELIEEVVIVGYEVPLIQMDNMDQGGTYTSETINNLPSREVEQIAVTTAGVSSKTNGNINIRGSRSGFACNPHTSEKTSNRNSEDYSQIVENKFLQPTDKPLSTFSIDVDRAAYSNVRRFLNNGSLPPVDAVRIMSVRSNPS